MAGIQDLASALLKLSSSYQDESAMKAIVHFCNNRWDIPAAFVVTYLGIVYATRKTIQQHSFASAVDWSFAFWNLALSLFSCWGVWHMASSLYDGLRHEGFYFTVCADTSSLLRYSGQSPTALALSLFCLSKIPELGDTVFLILKRKRVQLLQWYHHASVMLFCWLALATEYTPGVWFAATNYFVHAIMYMYFFLMTFKATAKMVKPIAPLITIIQITQMVWGLIVNSIAVGSYFRTGSCQIQSVTVYCAIVMYASYFVLFSRLFVESRRAAKKEGGSVRRSVSRKLSEALMGDTFDDAAQTGEKKLN